MPWQREAEFKDALEKAIKKGSKGAIATAQNIALQDMGQCYKHVCALVERQMRKAKANQRLNALYIISTICRHSLKKHKLQDKYTGRWTASIAPLVELVADLPASQMAQVEKVLASWKREKIFPSAIVDQCAVNAGVTLTQVAGLQSLPSGDAAASVDPMLSLATNGDANEVNIASPAMSIFSEPSAGSVDLAALEESFPPKTVASANMEAPSKMATPTAVPASNASTGSSRPPDPRKPPPADLYDPFAAESYDYDPFGSDPAPMERPHALPPLPSMTPPPSSKKEAAAGLPAAAILSASAPTDRQASGPIVETPQGNGMLGSSAPPAVPFPSLPPPPLSGQPASASRKRKSRWEEAGPDGSNHATDLAPAGLPDAATPAVPAMPAVPAEAPRPRRSRFSDAPPPHAASPQPGQGGPLSSPPNTHPQPPSTHRPPAQTATPSMPPMLPPSASEAAEPVLPPKPASARQDGEAQAAAALQAVEQMLQAKRHSDARNIAPSTSRPKQSPLPAHQPPLPRPAPPQPPLPQLPPPQPAFTDAMDPGTSHAGAGPSWHAGHAVHNMPALNARPPPPFPGQQPAFPHVPSMQGLPPGMPRPHMGHFAPQQFVQTGLQQHHRPAPLHHLPSMLQNQPRPPPHGRPQPHPPAPQQYRPPPPPPPQQQPPPPQPWPQQQGSGGMVRQPSVGVMDQHMGRPSASPVSRQLPPEADLGRFHTTNVAMDTPTDTGSVFAWKRCPPEGPPRTPGAAPQFASASSDQLHRVQDASLVQISAEDEAVPGPPPSPPAAASPPPPPVPMPEANPPLAPAGTNTPAVAGPSHAQSSAAAATPETNAVTGESRSQALTSTAAAAAAAAAAATSHAPNDPAAAVNQASIPPSAGAAHAAAPAGADEDNHDQHTDGASAGKGLKSSTTAHVADEEMDMSD